MRDDGEFEQENGDGLPWLEPADLEYADGPGFLTRRALIISGVTIVAVIALLWWVAESLGGNDIEVPAGGELPLVRAPEGPYKIAPDERGGMQLPEDEIGTHAVASGDGLPTDVATDQIPEIAVPVVEPVGASETAAADAPPRDLLAEREERQVREEAPARTEAAEAAPPASGGTAMIQLGAFSTRAKANQVWETLSGRYGYLAPLSEALESVEVNGDTLYRLRAVVPDGDASARDLCNRLKLAGEQCVVV